MYEWMCTECGLIFYTPTDKNHHLKTGCEACMCEECGTVSKSETCDYCESLKPEKEKSTHEIMWNGFWAGVGKDPKDLWSKDHLLRLQAFYERMVNNG